MVMRLSYRSKGSTQNQAFQAMQEQCFLWRRVTPFGSDFGLLHFADFSHAQKCFIT